MKNLGFLTDSRLTTLYNHRDGYRLEISISFKALHNIYRENDLKAYKSKRKAMNRNWCNQKTNPALNTKEGNK